MTQDEIIEMAKQAVRQNTILDLDDVVEDDLVMLYFDELEVFAKLVAQLERERIATSIERLPFGDTAASFAIYVRELKDE